MGIHDRIKQLRNERGMSQTELARKMGYKDKSSIARIEKGQGDLTQTQIVAFAKALRTTPMYLTDGVDEPKPIEIEVDIVDKINKLDESDMARLSAYLDGLLEKSTYKKDITGEAM